MTKGEILAKHKKKIAAFVALVVVGIIIAVAVSLTTAKKPTWHNVPNPTTAAGLRTNNNPVWKQRLYNQDYEIVCPDGAHITQGRGRQGVHFGNLGIKCSDDTTHMFDSSKYDAQLTSGQKYYDFGPDGIDKLSWKKIGPGGANAMGHLFSESADSQFLKCPENTKLSGIRGMRGFDDYRAVGNVTGYACI